MNAYGPSVHSFWAPISSSAQWGNEHYPPRRDGVLIISGSKEVLINCAFLPCPRFVAAKRETKESGRGEWKCIISLLVKREQKVGFRRRLLDCAAIITS